MTSAKISTPVLPAYILVIVMAMLPCSDMMVIKNCITEIKLRSFVLDVLIHDWSLWKASVEMVMSFEVL